MKIYLNSIDSARCKLCLEPIAWAVTYPNRRKVPLDRPISTQNLDADKDGHPYAEITSTTHFDTCAEYDPATGKPKVKPKAIEQAKLF